MKELQWSMLYLPSPQLDEYISKANPVAYLQTRLYRSDNKVDFVTDLATIKSAVLDRMFAEFEVGSTITKYDPAFFVDAEEYGMHWANILVELGLQLAQNQIVKKLTRNDATAGQTFTRATMESLLIWLEGNAPEIPIWSLALARLYLVVIQLSVVHEDTGNYPCYLMPFKPQMTYANMKTLLGNLEGEYAQAKVHMNRIGLGTIKFNRKLLDPQFVHLRSSVGHALQLYLPVCDDSAIAAGTEYQAMDNSQPLEFDSMIGIGEITEALGAWRVADDTANGPYFLTVLAAAGAGDCTIAVADVTDATFTQVVDTNLVLAVLRCGSNTQGYDWTWKDTKGYVLTRAAGVAWTAGSDYSIYLYRYLLRKQRTGKYFLSNPGPKPLPDRLMDGTSRNTRFKTNRRNRRSQAPADTSLQGSTHDSDDSTGEAGNYVGRDELIGGGGHYTRDDNMYRAATHRGGRGGQTRRNSDAFGGFNARKKKAKIMKRNKARSLGAVVGTAAGIAAEIAKLNQAIQKLKAAKAKAQRAKEDNPNGPRRKRKS